MDVTYKVTTTASSANYTIWNHWNNQWAISTASNATTTITISDVWAGWITGSSSSTQRIVIPEATVRFDPPIANLAQKRALRLLRSTLTAEQQRQLDDHQAFEVLTANGTARYLVARGRSGNVYKLDAKGQPIKRFCVHPGVWCPDEDTMLSQKLLLETNPLEFERMANVHPLDQRGRDLARRLAA